MTIQIQTTVSFRPVFLNVAAKPRYWEDTTVNGVTDTEDGKLIPFRDGDTWNLHIDLSNGRVLGWPEGTTAEVHYKVCDTGQYWLEDADGKRAKWTSDYVPNDLLAIGEDGYGDYIILKISAEGMIQGWKQPMLNGKNWKL
jgi:hypothetical protein